MMQVIFGALHLQIGQGIGVLGRPVDHPKGVQEFTLEELPRGVPNPAKINSLLR
jgi:hypothetical protein